MVAPFVTDPPYDNLSLLVTSLSQTVARGDDISALHRMTNYHWDGLLRIAIQEDWLGLAIFRCTGRQNRNLNGHIQVYSPTISPVLQLTKNPVCHQEKDEFMKRILQ